MLTKPIRLAVDTRPDRFAVLIIPAIVVADDKYPAVPSPTTVDVMLEFKLFVFKKVLGILIVTIPVPAAGDTLIFVPPTT